METLRKAKEVTEAVVKLDTVEFKAFLKLSLQRNMRRTEMDAKERQDGQGEGKHMGRNYEQGGRRGRIPWTKILQT